jgi:hypothetical protein
MEEGDSSSFAAKYPKEVSERGYVQIPKCLITCMAELDLKPQEAVVLFNIMEKCWQAGSVSWQKVDTMAANVGRKNSATRVITKSLADKGFITKTQRYDSSNLYGLEPLGDKLAEHLEHCRHIAGNPTERSLKSDSRGRQKSSDYIEPVLTKTNNLDPFYSQVVKGNNTDERDNVSKIDKTKHPCMTSNGIKHEWETFDVEKPENKNGEEVMLRYWQCIHCDDKFHQKINVDDLDKYHEYPLA